MTSAKSPQRQHFETERRRSAVMAGMAGIGIGIIVADTWVDPWLGVPGGLAGGGLVYATVYLYESLMWRRNNDR